MKNNKLVLLIVVGILLIAGVTVFVLTKSNVGATTCNHDWSEHNGVCTICGAQCDHYYVYHDPAIVMSEATCTTTGELCVAACPLCGAIFCETTPTVACKDENNDNKCDWCNECITHKWSVVYKQAATCTTNEITYYCCLECSQYKYYKTGEALGHNLREATCTLPATCQRENCTYTEGDPLGHNLGEATCTEPKTCQRQGCTYTEGNALGHILNEATCTEPVSCERCDYTEGTALGHTWTDATCTTPKTCSVCNTTEGNALGHDLSEATCTEAATCQREGCTYTEGDPLGHNLSEATCTEAATCQRTGCTYTEGTALGHTWTDATCTTPKTCSVCNTTEGEALGHIDSDQDGICDRCEEEVDEGEDEPEHICTAKTTYETSETEHWKICSDTNCNEEIAESRGAHNDANNDGVCDVCAYTMSTGNEDEGGDEPEHTCTAKTTYETSETEHWKICSDTTCNKEISESREAHKDEDNNKVCDVCEYAMNTENEGGEGNGDEDGEKEECKHTNKEYKSDEEYHWYVCKDCKEEIKDSKEKHVFVDGVCKNCKKEDTTGSKNELPDTGAGATIIAIAVLAVLVAFGAIKVRKYKDV